MTNKKKKTELMTRPMTTKLRHVHVSLKQAHTPLLVI
jgi:hypothetical protein